MKFAVAVGAEDDALGDFGFDSFKRRNSRPRPGANVKFFLFWIKMMKIKAGLAFLSAFHAAR